MPASSKATMNMVENTISSQKNCSSVTSDGENQGYYLKGDKETLFIDFSNESIDIFNKDNHLKSYNVSESKDMKEAMNDAYGIIKDIKATLKDIDSKSLGIEAKQELKQESRGIELD